MSKYFNTTINGTALWQPQYIRSLSTKPGQCLIPLSTPRVFYKVQKFHDWCSFCSPQDCWCREIYVYDHCPVVLCASRWGPFKTLVSWLIAAMIAAAWFHILFEHKRQVSLIYLESICIKFQQQRPVMIYSGLVRLVHV